jgi:hypothetical protein
MLQLNFLHKARDSGSDAEPGRQRRQVPVPEPRGELHADAAPCRRYGFVQLPLYQYVNGVQLTADWAVAAGLSLRF